jgi:hypothetical protein
MPDTEDTKVQEMPMPMGVMLREQGCDTKEAGRVILRERGCQCQGVQYLWSRQADTEREGMPMPNATRYNAGNSTAISETS